MTRSPLQFIDAGVFRDGGSLYARYFQNNKNYELILWLTDRTRFQKDKRYKKSRINGFPTWRWQSSIEIVSELAAQVSVDSAQGKIIYKMLEIANNKGIMPAKKDSDSFEKEDEDW